MIEIDSNEKILRVVHKHWFVLLSNILILIAFVFTPIILLFVLHLIPFENFLAFQGSSFDAGAFFLFLWLLIVWLIGWTMWIDYYLDVLIITDKRVFDIKQNGYFKRESASFRIDRIQNVTVDQKGLIQTLLDFGTIQMQTAGDNENLTATYIARPYEIKKSINEMQDQELDSSQEVHLHPDTLERIVPSNRADNSIDETPKN